MSDQIEVQVGSQDITVLVEGGALAAGMSLAQAELNTSVQEAKDAATEAEAAAVVAVNATINKLDIDGDNASPSLLDNIGAVGSGELAGGSGSGLVGYIQSGAGAVPEDVQEVLRRTIYAASFGASAGASAATNTDAIQNAIERAYSQGGGTVVLPAGDIPVVSIFTRPRVTIEGLSVGYDFAHPAATALVQTQAANPAIRIVSDVTWDTQKGVGIKGIIVKGHASATVSCVTAEAVAPYGITECDFEFETYGGLRAFEVISSGQNTFFLNRVQIKSDGCNGISFITYGAYNRYNITANYCGANAWICYDTGAEGSCVADGPIRIVGGRNSLYCKVETIHTAPGSPYGAAVSAEGSSNLLIQPTAVNCQAARVESSFQSIGTGNTFLSPQAYGSDFANYPFGFGGLGGGSGTVIIGGNVSCLFKMELYVPAETMAGLSFLGDSSSFVTLPDGVAVNGDVASSLDAKSQKIQIWNTPLTADRVVTLDTVSARKGAAFRILRNASATGAFALNVGPGPLKALSTGQWVEVYFDGFAWVLTAFGSL